ncbi:major facilitator superfamily domain-containing protein [Aspergillus alliaceus]|uniref:major facilitator superfamily domain-containing protein n=1 Tax=Petromyces alliaceus TaxID=209559 RepID=UPI0012A49BA9|nr:major facilitator superfamily domain-containing protein [Aspergillus alliaceus]KAB8230208.1 major facilitator superfamily domain-containing protein [Aspergillus alliaceus]
MALDDARALPEDWPKGKKILWCNMAFSDAFHVDNKLQLVLPNSVYLIGYIFGPLLFGPMSELYGRKPVLFSPFTGYLLFTLGCAVAPNWTALLIFRLLDGISASATLSIVGGLYADVFNNLVTRGHAIAVLVGVCIISFRSTEL